MSLIFGPWDGKVRQPVDPHTWWVRLEDERLAVRGRNEVSWVIAPVPMAEVTRYVPGRNHRPGVLLRNETLPDRAPNADRITCALDLGGMFGPEVDEALGVSGTDLLGRCYDAGVVDAWETGEQIPSPDEVRRLAYLTGMSPIWFYDGTLPTMSRIFICKR